MSIKKPEINDYEIQDLGNEYPIRVHGIHYYDADSYDDAERIVMLHCQLQIAIQALETIRNGTTSLYLKDICEAEYGVQPRDRGLRMRDVATMALIALETEVLPK